MNKIICISRQFASGGDEIGQSLSQHYKIPIYDRKYIITKMKFLGLNPEIIERNEESIKNRMVYADVMNPFTHSSIPFDISLANKIYQVQSEVIQNLASKGACVIMGWCAGEILRDNTNVVRIFIYADDEFRTK